MIIKNLYADNYRNLKDVKIEFNEKINIFCGENAQGKTNLIETIWLSSGVKNFRGSKEKDLINFNKEKSSLYLEFKDLQRKQKIEIELNKNIKNKTVHLNGVPLKSLYSLFGNLKCVVFTPLDLELSKGSPENRRSFLDLSISQIKPSYKDIVTKYENLLIQRNAVLKNIGFNKASVEDLEIWDLQLSKIGAYISLIRYNFSKKLNIFTSKLYQDMCENKEKFTLSYFSSIYDNLEGKNDYKGELEDIYYDKLKSNISFDIKSGFTQVGIHRDDIILKINNLSVKDFCSQGQQRSVALTLKLANAYILYEETGDPPVLLLDDVLSELDKKRHKFILSSIKDMQVFITCCNSSLLNIKNGKIFIIENGKVIKEKEK